MTERSPKQVCRAIVFHWTLLTILGFLIGFNLRQAALGGFGLGTSWGRLVEGAIIGTTLGLAQAFVLPGALRQSGWWVTAQIAGWAVGWHWGWELGWLIPGQLSFRSVYLVMGALAGAVAGVIQWPILGRQFQRAAWWILFSAGGWAVGLFVAMMIGGGLAMAVAGVIGGLVTGFGLIWLRQSRIEAPELTQDEPQSELD